MACETRGERRVGSSPKDVEARGALWSLPDGQRLPNLVEAAPLLLGDPTHPARLRLDDLENPEDFHARLISWLMSQG